MIDQYLKEFFSASTRKKIYALAGLMQLVITTFSSVLVGNAALAGRLAEVPLLIAIASCFGALVALLAKANVDEG